MPNLGRRLRAAEWAGSVISPIKAPLVLACLFLGVLLPLGIFGKIADAVREGDALPLDTPVLRFVHQYATPGRDAIFIFITHLGGVWVMIPFSIITLGLLAFAKRPYAAQYFAVAVGGAAVLDLGAKTFFGRARPDLWLSPTPEHDYSFPSGHATVTMAVAAALVIIFWRTKARWLAVCGGNLFVLAVGFSRLYLGVHYPSDVLGAWCASLVWATGTRFMWRSPLL